MSVGANIRYYRELKGYLQEELAKKVGVSSTLIGGIELGTRNPAFKLVESIALVLGVTPNDLSENFKKGSV